MIQFYLNSPIPQSRHGSAGYKILDMKTLDSKNLDATKALPFENCVSFACEPVTSASAFTRTVYKSEDAMGPSVGASDQPMEVDVDGRRKRNIALIDTTWEITDTGPQRLQPPYKQPKIDQADTESCHSPAIDKLLLQSCEVVKSALLQSYGNSPDSQTIARPVHGLQHSCRTAIWALSILQLRKLHHDPLALAFPDHMVPVLIKACLFHDTGREGDGRDTAEWEQASADNLREHLRNCGMEQSLAWQCGEAICHKDNPDACQHLPEAIQTLRSLLHDADTLDVIRVRPHFFMDKLECFVACQSESCKKNWRLLATEACKVIARQGDLLVSVALQNHEANDEKFFSIDSTGLCENTKKQWEHHPSPLSYQLFSIGEQSAFIRGLITPYTENLAEPPQSPFSLAKLRPYNTGTKECQSSWQMGMCYDPVNQQIYSIKPTSCELSARNQVLMANLSRLLGITVPESFVHQEQGRFYVVSRVANEWPGNLKSGKEALQSLSSEQWARLLLVNVIVGNECMVNSAWEGIELTPQGEPVMFHWDYAGLATRYLCADKPQSGPKADDFSSMPVLLKKLRDPRAPVMNSFPIENPCVDILAQLDDDLLGHTLQQILRQVDWQALDWLIEHSGFLAGDRSWLRQTIHDRIAWLTTRLPSSLEEAERVSMAEYKAIEAAGIRGGWLPVKGHDIRGGQICISQLLDANGKPITRMTLRLSGSAGNKLADNLALERGLHHLAARIRYINCALSDNYRDWRSELTSLASECNAMAEQLSKDKERWYAIDQDTIKRTVMNLQDIAEKFQVALTTDLPHIAQLPTIKIPLPVPAFPARVSAKMGEEAEARVQLAEFSHGFARLKGQSISYLDEQQLAKARRTTSPVRCVELKAAVCEGGSILFFPPKLPNAQAFEHKLIITFPGHSKAVVEALFRELSGLGIEGERPNTGELEEQWLDSLANYHGFLGDMNRAVSADVNTAVNTSKKRYLKERLELSDDALLDWEVHCRIRAGRLVHYRPGLPHGIMGNPAREFYLGHNINFIADRTLDTGQVVTNSLRNESALCSYERRTQIGMKPFGNAVGMHRRIQYDSNYVFSRILGDSPANRSKIEYTGAMNMIFKSEALGRLDGSIFSDLLHCLEPYSQLDAFSQNLKIIVNSAIDYQKLINAKKTQETRFSNPLSLLDELKIVEMSSPSDQQNLLHKLKKRYSHWPDGRPLEQLFRQSWSTCYYQLVCEHSNVKENIKELVKLCGEEGIQSLVEQNPQLLEGRLDSLDGMKLDGGMHHVCGVDLSGCSMNGTVLKSVIFRKCKLNTELLNSAIVGNIFFVKCSFEGERFSLSVLDNAKFMPATDKENYRAHERTHQLSRIIYQSCINQQNEFNLNQWLTVMEKSQFLRHFSTPLDDLSRNIISHQIERIIKDYRHQLPGIINGVLAVQFENIDCAIDFVRNNPEFYDRKVNNFRDLHFDFRISYLREKYRDVEWESLERNLTNLRSSERCDFPREAVLALIANTINFIMFPQPDSRYMEFGANSGYTDNQSNLWKNNVRENGVSTKNNTISPLKSEDMKSKKARFLLQLEQYQDYFHNLWKACTEESQLAIAKYCIRHHCVAVSHFTTLEFMKILTKHQEQRNWLSDFAAYMEKHKQVHHECKLLLQARYGNVDL